MRTLAILLVLAPVVASAVDERSPDEEIRRFALADDVAAIAEPHATEWLGQGTWLASDSRTRISIQQTAPDLASARAAVRANGVVVRSERTAPEAYVFDGTRDGFPIVRLVWRDDFYRPTQAFHPAFEPGLVVTGRPVSSAAVARVTTGVLARTPDRDTAQRLAALLWAQDYKEGHPPGRLLSERVADGGDTVRVARFTVARDLGARWNVTVWEWTLVADKRTRVVTRTSELVREIAAPCPAVVVEPAEGRTVEGLTVDVSIDPAAFTPRPHDRSAAEPGSPATITVRLSNPTDEDVYLVFRDDVLNFQVTDEQGARVWTGDEPIVGSGDQFHPIHLKPHAGHDVTYGWSGWHWKEGALPPGVYQVRGTVAPRTCGAHRLTETLSTPVGFRILAAGTP